MIITLCAVAISQVGVIAIAVVPTSITVQGKLTDAAGVPLTAGPKNFTFKIFGDSVGGAEVWPAGLGENQTLNSDAAGLWIGLVGAVIPMSDVVFQDTVRWLQVTVDGTTLPRVRLLTGPYAYRVSTIDGALGGTIVSKVAIGPGHNNAGNEGFVAGADNVVLGHYSSVSGGKDNSSLSDYTHVGGGGNNSASGPRATIAGGADNETGGDQATVGGGRYNKAIGLSSTVSGGYTNISTGIDSHIGGGAFDSASGVAATVAGGSLNRATGNFSTIGGGGANRVSATSATVAGGFQNTASSDDATVGGGYNNQAAGFRSTIPGGTGNIANGGNSFACGVNAQALHDQSFVWNDDPFNATITTAPHQFLIHASGGVGIGTTAPDSKLDVRGDIRMGSSGQYFATGGEENLKIVRGNIDDDGSISDGAGFTVTHPSTGKYFITFTVPFSGRPSAVASPRCGAPGCQIATVSASTSVEVTTSVGTAIDDLPFDFVAVGPR
jgi:hypothetical protein